MKTNFSVSNINCRAAVRENLSIEETADKQYFTNVSVVKNFYNHAWYLRIYAEQPTIW